VKEVPARSLLVIVNTSVVITILIWCWQSSLLYIDAETFDCRLRVTSKFLLFQLLHLNCSVSAYKSPGQCLFFSAELNFTLTVFDLILYINEYHWNKEVIDSNKEIYSVLKFTVWCQVGVLCWQSCIGISEGEAACPGFRRMSSVRVTNHTARVLNCGPSTRSACI